jgi:hypothetical protein
MCNKLIVVALLTFIALAAGLVCYRSSCDSALCEDARQCDTNAWLRREFHLTDGQYAAVEKLNGEYAIVCDRLCMEVQKAVKERDQARASSPADAAAISTAEARVGRLSADCEAHMIRHLERVAALMSPEDGRHFLGLLRPKVARPGHARLDYRHGW